MRVRGAGREALDLTDLLAAGYRTFLLFPSEDAVELNDQLVEQEDTPIQLIVPDGSWRQASKVPFRHHELKDVKRVMIRNTLGRRFYMRAQHRQDGMPTLQAIALALGVIEGDFVKHQLLKLYHAKIAQTLRGRGIFNLAEA